MLNIRKLFFEFYYFPYPWKDGGKIRESAKANCPETVGEVKGEAGEVKATEEKEGHYYLCQNGKVESWDLTWRG